MMEVQKTFAKDQELKRAEIEKREERDEFDLK